MSYISWEQAVQWLREQDSKEELVKACYFDDPLPEAAERFWKSLEWQSIASFLPSRKGCVLDLGAGRGISSYALAREGWQVTALEPDPSGLVGSGAIRSLCEATGYNVRIVSEHSEKLPFPENSFDAVNCRQVLHHSRDLNQTCREIFRVLKPSGVIIASREHVISKKGDLKKFLDDHSLHSLYGGENAFLLGEYLSAMRLAGLQIKKSMAPLDSPINYFPMSPEQHFIYCTKLVSEVISKPMTNFLFNPRHIIGRGLMKILISMLNIRDQTPGRLYTFVAVKPN